MSRSAQRTNLFRATLAGIADQLRHSARSGTHSLSPSVRLDGLECLVTGATSGLGKATAIGLAQLGARVMLPARTTEQRACRDVQDASGSEAVELEYLDLADLESIDRFCRAMEEQGRSFDIVVLNAGVVTRRSRRTKQGFEEMFAVNYLANFALVNGLLKAGVIPNRTFASAKGARDTDNAGPTPRIIFVSSEEHRTACPYDWSGFGLFEEFGISGAMAGYARSKYLLTTYAAELARRLSTGGDVDVAVHSLCPGAVNTNIAREAPGWSQWLLRLVFSLFFSSPEDASEPLIYLSCEPSLEGETGVYLHLMSRKEIAEDAASAAAGQRLWAASERLLAEGSAQGR